MRGTGLRHGARLALVGLLGAFAAAGCRHSSRPVSSDPSPEPAVTLDDSQVADVQVALGRTMESRGQNRQSIPLYAEAVRKDPRRADGWVRLAVNSDKEGMFTESAEYYQKALVLEPDNADTYCNLGYSLYLQQRLSEAEAALRRAVELKPDHKRARNNLGLVLARSGRGTDALAAFRQAGCTQADAHTNLAYAMTLQGQFPEARAQYEHALALDATSAPARKGLGELAAVAPKTVEPVMPKAAPKAIEPAPAVVPAAYFEPAPAERTPSPPTAKYTPRPIDHTPPLALEPLREPEPPPIIPAVTFYRIPVLPLAPRVVVLTSWATTIRVADPVSTLKAAVVSGQADALDPAAQTEVASHGS